MAVMEHISRKFTMSRAMPVYVYMRGDSTANACLMEPIYQKSIACDSGGAFIEKIVTSLLEKWGVQILKKDYDIDETAKAENAAKLYLWLYRGARNRFTRVDWKTSETFPALQSFPLMYRSSKLSPTIIWSRVGRHGTFRVSFGQRNCFRAFMVLISRLWLLKPV